MDASPEKKISGRYLAVLSLLRSDELGAIVGIVRRRTKASADVSP